ncbi:MAG: class I SAM-dependent rRNA methyltransferase [Planctomycetales bacterium]|nr:class I SAM-dependent rRNA methyltransferase [Planctomycetales bacterium]
MPASPRKPKRRQSAVRSQRRAPPPSSGHASPATLPLWPEPSASLAAITLAKPTTHPTVFRKRIRHIDGHPQCGDWVSLYHEASETGQPELFAYGLFNPKSEIAVRIVRWSPEVPDEPFWEDLLDRAIALRTETLGLDRTTTAYRLIHAEADGLPGLVVDRYGDCLSAEVFSMAMAPRAAGILERLAARLGTRHWLIQPSPHFESQEGFVLSSRASESLPTQVVVAERGTQYRVHFGTGHKTGFFCDQRDNRRQLAEFCGGKSVLDLCCYTGGFAVMAAKLGAAREVIGVDLDEEPLRTAKQNADLNQVRIKFAQADAFAYMRDMLRIGKQFDVVVLDPPKLIRNRGELEEGTRKHFDLNRLAMQLVRPGGLMLTCSCAGLLPAAEFTRLVRSAARGAFQPNPFNPHPVPRQMQILAHSGAALCHPVSGNCPESEYLKAMWLRL